jgi:hypothetical protein
MRCYVESVGVLGLGLTDWSSARTVLSGAQPYISAIPPLPKLDLLPAAERRRTGAIVKYALAAGIDALAGTQRAASDIPTVFAASGGDGDVLHEICSTLASSDRQVSPTRFHNSVHNAAAGYWSIATAARVASTSICAYDWTFAAGLLEATTQVITEHEVVLLIVADVAYPEPLYSARPTRGSFACALLLSRDSAAALCALEVEFKSAPSAASRVDHAALEALRATNPAARALPLLCAIAQSEASTLSFDYLQDASLSVAVLPKGSHGQ